MANPQAEDGYTKIANEILDHLARLNLSAYESRILFYILRQTYGWNRKFARISFTSFERGTGIKRRHIQRALKSLIKRNIVTYTGYGTSLSYGIQKNYEKWKSLPKEVTGAKNIENGPTVTYRGTPSLPKEVTKSLPKEVTHKRKKDKEKEKDQQAGFSYTELIKKTDKLCKSLNSYFKKQKFNAFLWRQSFMNQNGHPLGIEYALNELWRNKEGIKTDPVPYLKYIFKSKGPEYNYQDSLKQHENLKKEMNQLTDFISRGRDP